VADLHRVSRLTVVRPGVPAPPAAVDERVVSLDEFAAWARRGAALAHLGRYSGARLLVHRVESAGRPLPLGLALRWLSRGRVSIEDAAGRARVLTAGLLARWSAQLAIEPFRVPALLRRIEREVAAIEVTSGEARRRAPRLDLAASPMYLRTDLSFGVRAGGSVAHIAGVVNELDRFTGPVVLLTTDDVPTLKATVDVHRVAPAEAFWNFRELPTFLLNDAFEAASAVIARAPAFVYQRYSLNNFAGIRIARRHGVPFVLEYNGSEIWMGRHWGRPLRYEPLSRRIEQLNLASADLIVVVSRAMAEEVVGRGIDPAAVLVNPNGVDADRYTPEVDGREVRERFNLGDRLVVGFIGTFGPWHGAEVLARAFVEYVREDPARADTTRLLMIGAGARLPASRQILADAGVLSAAAFTGLVPQEEGPAHLAACDVLASPHVPNPDGTRFFGSPTKLFEYMAMGKAIVASDLEQIGEVLDHGRTAWLVAPGDAGALASALRRLGGDRGLRQALGAAARREALARHTWREHTRRTIERLDRIAGRVDVPAEPVRQSRA
jgi:glycosyltransferase involved in cell wall biosynthesis